MSVWGLFGAFPFTYELMGLFATEDEAEFAKRETQRKGPHMGESFKVKEIDVYEKASDYLEEGW